jgi:hypothetical protein
VPLLPVARSVSQQRTMWRLCYVTRGNAKVTWYSPTPGACDVIAACCVATHGAEKTPLPLLLCSVYSVASCLPVGYLTRFCCVIQQWIDMSQYFLLHSVQTDTGDRPVSYAKGTGDFSLGGKVTGPWRWPLISFLSRDQDGRSYISKSLYALRVCCLIS